MANDPRFTIRVTRTDKKRVEKVAYAQDESVSEWVRAALDAWPLSEPLSVDRERLTTLSLRLDPKRRAKLNRLARRERISLGKALATIVTRRLDAEATESERSAPRKPSKPAAKKRSAAKTTRAAAKKRSAAKTTRAAAKKGSAAKTTRAATKKRSAAKTTQTAAAKRTARKTTRAAAKPQTKARNVARTAGSAKRKRVSKKRR